jgi:(E)-4-hydroxy-3-methylbut-2-enyl-diphosphate synthase
MTVTYRSEPHARKLTVGVKVGGVIVGGGAPVVVQSMTNTDTADIDATVAQVAALARAGSESCASRSTATRAPPPCRASASGSTGSACRRAAGRRFPLYRPQAAGRSSGLRRGAGEVPHQSRQCRLQGQEGQAVRRDRRDGDPHDKPVRIGVNWGSLDQELLTR